jgi:hypothetical protein
MYQIVIDSLESEIYGIFALVVHAHTQEQLYFQRRSVLRIIQTICSFQAAHLVDHSVPHFQLPKVSQGGDGLVVYAGDVGRLDRASV